MPARWSRTHSSAKILSTKRSSRVPFVSQCTTSLSECAVTGIGSCGAPVSSSGPVTWINGAGYVVAPLDDVNGGGTAVAPLHQALGAVHLRQHFDIRMHGTSMLS